MTQIKETTRLWYHKYLYKAVVETDHGYAVSHISKLSSSSFNKEKRLISLLGNRSYMTRGEGRSVSIFTNDVEIINDLKEKWHKDLKEIWRPPAHLKNKLKPGTIFVKTPKEFNIKVNFNSKKVLEGFKNWIDANPDKIVIGKNAQWRLDRQYPMTGYYFYLKDEKVLSLVNLLISGNIKRVDRLVCSE